MKPLLLILLCLSSIGLSVSQARLGETVEQMSDRWGKGSEYKSEFPGCTWKKGPYTIQAQFTPKTGTCFQMFISKGTGSNAITKEEAIQFRDQFCTPIKFKEEEIDKDKLYKSRGIGAKARGLYATLLKPSEYTHHIQTLVIIDYNMLDAAYRERGKKKPEKNKTKSPLIESL